MPSLRALFGGAHSSRAEQHAGAAPGQDDTGPSPTLAAAGTLHQPLPQLPWRAVL